MKTTQFSDSLDGISVYVLYDAFLRGRLSLRPVRKDHRNSFQRWQWWPRKKKIYLIHSIFEGTTLPPIYVYRDNRKQNWYIVDGQQRLSCLFEFMQNELRLTQKGMMENDTETLDEELDGKTWEQLSQETQDIIGSYELRIEEVNRTRDMDDEEFDQRVRDFFHRINVTSGSMSEQEINNNRYAGRLTDLLFDLQKEMGFKAPTPKSLSLSPDEAGESYFLFENKICTRTDLLRMNDMELILSLLHAMDTGECAHKNQGVDQFYKSKEDMLAVTYTQMKASFMDTLETIQEMIDTNLFSLADSRFRKKNDFYTLWFAAYITEVSSYPAAAKSLTQFDALVTATLEGDKATCRRYTEEWQSNAAMYLASLAKDWSFKENRETRVRILSELMSRKKALLA